MEHSEELAPAVDAWLAAPGPALLDVVVERGELVMPPKIEVGEVAGMALYGAKAMLAGAERRSELGALIKDALLP